MDYNTLTCKCLFFPTSYVTGAVFNYNVLSVFLYTKCNVLQNIHIQYVPSAIQEVCSIDDESCIRPN